MDKIVLCLRSSLCADGIATTHTAHHAPQQHRQSNKRSWKFRLKPWFCQQTLKKHFGIYSCAVVPDNMAVFYVTVLKGPGCWQCGHYTRSGPLSEAGFWQLHMRSWQVHLTKMVLFFTLQYEREPGCWQCGHYTHCGSRSEAAFWQLHMRSWKSRLGYCRCSYTKW